MQDKFSWAGVAAAGIGAGVGHIVGSSLKPTNTKAGQFGQQIVTTTAAVLASAATRSVIEGTSFGDNIIAALPSMIGQMLVDGASLAASERSNNSEQPAQGTIRDTAAKAGNGAAAPSSQDGQQTGTVGQAAEDAIVVTASLPRISIESRVNSLMTGHGRQGFTLSPQQAAAQAARAQVLIGMMQASGKVALPAKPQEKSFLNAHTYQGGSLDGITRDEVPLANSYVEGLRYDRRSGEIGVDRQVIGPDGKSLSQWEVNETLTRFARDEMSELNWALGGFLGITAGGGLFAASAPAWLPTVASFAGYEGSTATILQAAGLKAGIGLSIELGGNHATGSEATIGGLTGTVLASTLIAPAATKLYGLGAKGLTIAGGASGFGGNLVGQGIDYANGLEFSATDLAMSTIFGALGGRLAAPLQDRYGATSLLFQKWSPMIEELYTAPATVTGAVSDFTRKVMTPTAKQALEGK